MAAFPVLCRARRGFWCGRDRALSVVAASRALRLATVVPLVRFAVAVARCDRPVRERAPRSPRSYRPDLPSPPRRRFSALGRYLLSLPSAVQPLVDQTIRVVLRKWRIRCARQIRFLPGNDIAEVMFKRVCPLLVVIRKRALEFEQGLFELWPAQALLDAAEHLLERLVFKVRNLTQGPARG